MLANQIEERADDSALVGGGAASNILITFDVESSVDGSVLRDENSLLLPVFEDPALKYTVECVQFGLAAGPVDVEEGQELSAANSICFFQMVGGHVFHEEIFAYFIGIIHHHEFLCTLVVLFFGLAAVPLIAGLALVRFLLAVIFRLLKFLEPSVVERVHELQHVPDLLHILAEAEPQHPPREVVHRQATVFLVAEHVRIQVPG